MGRRMDDLHAPTVASGPTSRPPANGGPKQQTLQEMMSEKENVEAELSALGSVLDSHGVNMNTSLLTFDGFPRSDIDVAQIRTTRARIIRLKNDHKAIMAKLETAVHEQFAKAAQTPSQANTNIPGASNPIQSGRSPSQSSEIPFAKVNTVAPSSPADLAGLKPGDQVIKFGNASFTNHDRLTKVAQVVQQNENRPITVRVLRESPGNETSQTLDLRLIPRRDWGGRGLLGCHLLPL